MSDLMKQYLPGIPAELLRKVQEDVSDTGSVIDTGPHAHGFIYESGVNTNSVKGKGFSSYRWNSVNYEQRLELSTPVAPNERLVELHIRQNVAIGAIGYHYAYEFVDSADSAEDQARYVKFVIYDEMTNRIYISGSLYVTVVVWKLPADRSIITGTETF